MIRVATTDDLEFLLEHDRLIARELIPRKVADSRVYVATAETGEIVGWLRWGLWYDLIPFMNMLYLLEPHRRKGIGRQLVELWEHDMRERGCDTVMTSTQADEEGQFFYRKLGYVDTGVLLLPGEPAEIILRKSI
jgi:GNAT superfamily N-acetyltransferase